MAGVLRHTICYGLSLMMLLVTVSVLAQEPHRQQDSNDSITIAYAEHWPPFSYHDSSGKPAGILIEIANFLLRDQMGLEVTHVLRPWRRAQAMVENGTFDALLAVPNEDRLTYTRANSSEIYSMQVRAFIAQGSVNYRELSASENPLQGLGGRFSLMSGDKTSETIYRQHHVKFETNRNIQQIFKMMAAGRTDLLLHSKVAAIRSLFELGLHEHIKLHPKVFKNVSLYLMVSNRYSKQRTLLSRVDNLLHELKKKQKYYNYINKIEYSEIESSLETAKK